MTSGIYMLEHRETKRRYIGRSVNIEHRWHEHRSDAKRKRGNNPVHNALRKYGAEAFIWKILITAPVRLQPLLEAQFIADWKTMKPHGYNLGGTEGGFPSREVINAMEPDERDRWNAVLARVARLGHATLRELRKDREYEAEYRAKKCAASVIREARMRERRASDPAYDEKERARRVAASKKNPNRNDAKMKATFRERMNNPEYAAKIREQRAAAGRISWEKRRARRKAIETATHEALRRCLSS